MEKLRLDVEELRVESFEASADCAGAGTVRGLELEEASGTSLRPCLYTEQRTCTC